MVANMNESPTPMDLFFLTLNKFQKRMHENVNETWIFFKSVFEKIDLEHN